MVIKQAVSAAVSIFEISVLEIFFIQSFNFL